MTALIFLRNYMKELRSSHTDSMKKIMRVGLLSLAIAFPLLSSGCDLEEMTSLKDISKPYVGEYQCRKLTLAGEDELDRFEEVKLNLGYDGKFQLSYVDAEGGEDAYEGSYTLYTAQSTVKFSAETQGKEATYVFPYERGKIVMELLMNGKLLYAEFSMLE